MGKVTLTSVRLFKKISTMSALTKKVSAECVFPLRALTSVSTKLYWIRMENRFFGGHSPLIMPSRKCAFSFVNCSI